ncbi:MAG: DUF1570 domain-containing protein [Planctomycetota bacterium]|nr:MAG: DUF1570 domain-containing protein [Planctomycetota bacterium]
MMRRARPTRAAENRVARRRFLLTASAGLCAALRRSTRAAPAVFGEEEVSAERFRFRDGVQTRTLVARVLIEAADGGVLLESRDQRYWVVQPDELLERRAADAPFAYFDAKSLGAALQREAAEAGVRPPFDVVATRRYVICTNAGSRYAEWCGALFERLMAGFTTHWRSRVLRLHRPPAPLPAIVLADRSEFDRYAETLVGRLDPNVHGFYSPVTNRMVLYDLTASPNEPPARSWADITRKLAADPFNISTVVHEATHQIAFNSGMHRRLADTPPWLVEGMAMYFETPDLNSRNGWRTIGRPNPWRLRPFLAAARRGRILPLEDFVTAQEVFADPQTAPLAYAQAWALTYFLIKTARNDMLRYLRTLSRYAPLIERSDEQKRKDFTAAFGTDFAALQRSFLAYMSKLAMR